MNAQIREALRAAGLPVAPAPQKKPKEEIMDGTPVVGISAEQLQQMLTAVLTAAKQMNPMEQKKYDEMLKQEQRRTDMTLALGKAEEASQQALKNHCSHCRWPANSGRRSGEPAPRGQGEWVTGGQLHPNDTASLICLRCGTTWHWMTSPAEREYINNAGLLNFGPPPPERLLTPCPHCDGAFTPDHIETCAKKPVAA